MYIKKISILILCLLLVGCTSNNTKASIYQIISTEKVYEMKDDETITIIDVRSILEYSSGHIENAINIPVNNIEDVLEIVEEKDRKIIVYCASGGRSKQAAEKLIDLGYTNVYDMKGLDSWNYELKK